MLSEAKIEKTNTVPFYIPSVFLVLKSTDGDIMMMGDFGGDMYRYIRSSSLICFFLW